MDFIMDSIDFIVRFFETISNFFLGIIENSILLGNYIGQASLLSFEIIGSMPTWLVTFGKATICISIVYVLLGRNTGGG